MHAPYRVLRGRVAALAAAAWAVPVIAATPVPLRPAPETAVQRIDDYAAAIAAARAAGALLLVSVEPRSGDPADLVGRTLERPDLQRRFAASGTPWVFCRLGMDAGGGELAAAPSLVEMRRGPGVFVVDHAHPEYDGRVVSMLPRTAGKYYRFAPEHVAALADLPAGSLTQRSLVLAVRIHPEGPQSTAGECDPGLAVAATEHSAHQARIRRQGHHGWETRARQLGGSVAEVCAESWPDQDLLDSCVDCVASWRQSAGHWNAVRSPQAAFGYDIRRGSNGIWYATGVFRR
jgi:hypothetical protein